MTTGSARNLLVVVATTALLSTGCVWSFETLDGDHNGPTGSIDANVGTYNATVLYNGRPHVFYYAQTGGNLRHAYYNGLAWVFETLDGAGGPTGRINADVGTDSAAVLYNGRPHVFYRDETNDDLRHGYYNGTAWVFETLDGAGGSAGRTTHSVGVFNTVTLYNGRPHVFYYDATTVDLRHGYWNGQFWAFETLDGAGGPNGRINAGVGWYSAVVIYNGRPHVFHHNVDAGHFGTRTTTVSTGRSRPSTAAAAPTGAPPTPSAATTRCCSTAVDPTCSTTTR